MPEPALLFDCDRVLAHTFEANLHACRAALHRVLGPEAAAALEREAFADPARRRPVEKPAEPASRTCWCGPLAFGSAAGLDAVLRTLTPSARGEYEVVDALNHFLAKGTDRPVPARGPWLHVGTPGLLEEARRALAPPREASTP